MIGIPEITLELNAPPIATTLTAALFILSMGLAPVVWAALSDYYRIRRFLLMLSMTIFGFASLGSALVNNVWGLVVLRCIQALGSSCAQVTLFFLLLPFCLIFHYVQQCKK